MLRLVVVLMERKLRVIWLISIKCYEHKTQHGRKKTKKIEWSSSNFINYLNAFFYLLKNQCFI